MQPYSNCQENMGNTKEHLLYSVNTYCADCIFKLYSFGTQEIMLLFAEKA